VYILHCVCICITNIHPTDQVYRSLDNKFNQCWKWRASTSQLIVRYLYFWKFLIVTLLHHRIVMLKALVCVFVRVKRFVCRDGGDVRRGLALRVEGRNQSHTDTSVLFNLPPSLTLSALTGLSSCSADTLGLINHRRGSGASRSTSPPSTPQQC